MVMMWAVRVLLISSIMPPASVLLPLPVVPVDQDQSAFLGDDLLEHGGSARSSIVAASHRDDAEAHADRAALLEGVAPEPAQARHAVRPGRPRGRSLNVLAEAVGRTVAAMDTMSS